MSPIEGHEFDIMRILGEIQADVASTKTSVEALAGPNGRVTKLENDARTTASRQWIHTAVLLPLSFILHSVMAHFGISIPTK